MKITISSIINFFIMVLVAIMPFHVLIFNLIGNSVLTLWRDALLLIIVFLEVFGIKKTKKNDFLYILMLIKIASCFFYAILFHDSNMSNSIWINVLRVYLFPSLIIFALRKVDIKKTLFLKCCKIYIGTAVIVSIFGIIQMFFIGREYLRLIGVGQSSVLLDDGTQRNIGVFESANVMAIYVLFALVILLNSSELFSRKKKIVFIVILTISIILTFSVSVIIVTLIFFVIKLSFFKKTIKQKYIIRAIAGVGLIVTGTVIIVCINPSILIFIGQQFESKMNDVINTVQGTNYNSSSSAFIHFSDVTEGTNLLLKNPNGLGFAKESFMVADKVYGRVLIGLKESSLLTIMYDYGLLVGSIFLLPFFFGLFEKKHVINSKSNVFTKRFILFATLFVYFFLPIVQSYEITFFANLFLGLFTYYEYADN